MDSDYTNQILSGPRKKVKKKYILFLYSKESQGSHDVKAIERGFQRGGKNQIIIRLHSPEEGLKVLMLKSIDLIVLDNSIFDDEVTSVEFAAELKKRRKIPILFIAKDEQRLISAYQEHLRLYEELDDYVLSPVDPIDFSHRFKRSSSEGARAAKRFNADAEIEVFRLLDSKTHKSRLRDLSMVGLGILVPNVNIKRGEQIRAIIDLRYFGLFHPQFGDVFKVAATVRRLSIDGSSIGCSLEHVTPIQSECLTTLLERMSTNAIFKNGNRTG